MTKTDYNRKNNDFWFLLVTNLMAHYNATLKYCNIFLHIFTMDD